MRSSIKYEWITWYNNIKVRWNRNWAKLIFQLRKMQYISKLKKVDKKKIPYNPKEIRLFAIMRNESLRLPHFIEYYKNLKIDRFFLISNNSTDNSVGVALSYEDVHVFETDESYENHWCWMEHFLEKYGKGHWCVVVDIDELFYFPYAETLSISNLCQCLEATGSTAVRSLLLDMYSDWSVRETVYISGYNPLESIPYFDKEYYEFKSLYFDRYQWKYFEATQFAGGMRDRVLGRRAHMTNLNKFPLFKFMSGTYLGQGMHAINGANISDLQGVVFHTKFLSDCIQEANEESIREQHFDRASYYKDFKYYIDHNPDLCLASPDSVCFQNSTQLVELGLMKTNERLEELIRTQMLKKAINTF